MIGDRISDFLPIHLCEFLRPLDYVTKEKKKRILSPEILFSKIKKVHIS